MSELPISTIVSVSITRESAYTSQEGFGIPLILGPNATFSDRVQECVDMDEVADLYSTSDPEYVAANAYFSQLPRVESVKFGKQAAEVAQQTTLTFSADIITGNTINGKINGVAITPVPFNTSHNQTMTDLASIINALTAVDASVTAARVVTVTSHDAGIPFTATEFVVTGGATQATCTIATTVDNHGVTEDLNEICEEDDDWYGLTYVEHASTTKVKMAAAWAESQNKLFGTCSDDANIIDDTSTTDIAYELNALNYDNTWTIYNGDDEDYADAAFMGSRLPYTPGTETWKFANLSGIVADDFTTSEKNAAIAKNCNIYAAIGGRDCTMEGVCASGIFIDYIRLIHWMTARIKENVFGAIVEKVKIPYTDEGIAIIENHIREVLQYGVDNGMLSSYTITVPKAADVSDADKEARELKDVKFTATISGAIHKVTIAGTVSV
jgi:hypothetical protein